MKSKKLCSTKRCMNNRAPTRTICHTCFSKKARAKNPLWYAWRNLASSAAKRGLEFSLTFEFFSEMAVQTDYINKKGVAATSYTIDRKDSTKGYTPDNVQVMLKGLNSAKGNKELRYDWQTGWAKVVTRFDDLTQSGPF